MKKRMLWLSVATLALTACGLVEPVPGPKPSPDYRIQVQPTEDGYAAVPPACPDWKNNPPSVSENDPWPQYGCATARNLAQMIDDPQDLLEGRDMGDPDTIRTDAAIRRYYLGQTKNLIDPNAKGPSSAISSRTSAEAYK